MFKKPLLLSLSTFFILMVFISTIKNNTRNIEKSIEQLSMEISILKKDLLNAEIDFIYLSSPEKLLLLNKKIFLIMISQGFFYRPKTTLIFHQSRQKIKND